MRKFEGSLLECSSAIGWYAGQWLSEQTIRSALEVCNSCINLDGADN